MSERNLFYLHELPDYKVASGDPDIRGWQVKDRSGKNIGTVDNLLVNKSTERVVYLTVEMDESLAKADGREALQTPVKEGVHDFITKEGENHIIIPIGMVKLDEDKEEVINDEINYDTLISTRRFAKNSTIEPGYELVVFGQYTNNNVSNPEKKSGEDFYDRKEFKRRGSR